MWDKPPSPAVGELAGAQFAPAPLGESRARLQIVQRRVVTVALGKNARSHLNQAFAQAFGVATGDLELELRTHTDRDAVEHTTMSSVDLAVIGGSLSDQDQAAGLCATRIGVELFVLAVPADSPVRSLSSQQVRQVLTGSTRSWSDLGFDRGPIRVFVPRDGDLRERAARTLIKGDAIFDEAEQAANDRGVLDAVRGIPGAIGLVRLRAGAVDERVRMLQIDWVQPSIEAFSFRAYPYGIPLQVVTQGYPGAIAKRFVDFAASEDGREVLGRDLIVR